MKPTFFKSQAEFRKWLEKNHDQVTELWVGLQKKGSGQPGLQRTQAVDEALCFGWIDGLTKSIDDSRWMIRFTPRKPKSIWSAVNIKRVGELKALGLMKPSGLAAFEKRDEKRMGLYSFEQAPHELAPAYEKQFRASKKAWAFYESQAPWYRRTAQHWVMTAKKEETRLRRLAILIECSAEGKRVPPFAGPKSAQGK
jgi:uncharacterized protein YdeI (YjbR/CyaY-like superfamily)